METVPGAAEGALPLDGGCDGRVGRLDGGVDNVDAVVIDEGGVGAFPGGDATAAVAKKQLRRLEPGSAEAVQEVSLAGDDGFVEVGVAKFADINLFSLVSIASSHSRVGKMPHTVS